MAHICILPDKTLRPIKPVHGIGQPPFISANFSLFHYLTEAGIPFSRLHDLGSYLGGRYVDIHCIFPDFSRDVEMTVEQVGAAENGRCTVVLSTMDYLKETMLLREQTAELIFERSSGLRVPKTCLRMVTKTSTDPESGETVEKQELGLYDQSKEQITEAYDKTLSNINVGEVVEGMEVIDAITSGTVGFATGGYILDKDKQAVIEYIKVLEDYTE